jgi:hypothetical protein
MSSVLIIGRMKAARAIGTFPPFPAFCESSNGWPATVNSICRDRGARLFRRVGGALRIAAALRFGSVGFGSAS